MQTASLWLGFVVGVAVFAAWLTYTLRQERDVRVAHVARTHERLASHRRATLTAHAVATVPTRAQHVVRPGSFCRVVGAVGATKRGVTLVCQPSATGRPRWVKAETVDADRLAS
jgi:hypothetical protein